jgi:DNA invertase Pin-like site-specific DNA recombinase
MKNNKQVRIAIYKRVSTLEQAVEGSSLQAQEELLVNFIKANKDKGRILEN